MTNIELKNILLSLNIFIDNIYLDFYCSLIINNLNTLKEKYKTQSHHIIPVCYYWYIKGKPQRYSRSKVYEKESKSDPLNFTVNLLYKDHILAHYYLCMASINPFKQAMIHAYIKMTKSKSFDMNILPEEILDNYQDLYEQFCYSNNNFRGKHHTKEWCEQHSADMKGRVTYERTPEIKDKIRNTLKAGYAEGKYRLSDQSIVKKSHKGADNGRYGKKYKRIYKDSEIKLIPLDSDIPEGWSLNYNKPILQLDLDNNIVNEFVNIKVAAATLGLHDSSMIGAVCRGKYKSAYGYKWKYK